MRINFGCGRQVLDGSYNIDAVRSPKAPRDPELIHAIEFTKEGAVSNPIPLPDGCADELWAMHVIEHVYAWQTPALVREWQRLLKQNGILIIECPNIEAAARNLLAGMNDQMVMFPFYGDPSHHDPFMCHRWGFTPKTIQQLLASVGFKQITMAPPRTHGARLNRDMRVEARK